jgi:hypothetical protein
MLARGIEAVVQCSATLAGWFDGPTVRRGEPLDGFAAAAPAAQPAASPELDARRAAAAGQIEPHARTLLTHWLVHDGGASC